MREKRMVNDDIPAGLIPYNFLDFYWTIPVLWRLIIVTETDSMIAWPIFVSSHAQKISKIVIFVVTILPEKMESPQLDKSTGFYSTRRRNSKNVKNFLSLMLDLRQQFNVAMKSIPSSRIGSLIFLILQD